MAEDAKGRLLAASFLPSSRNRLLFEVEAQELQVDASKLVRPAC